MPISLSKPDYLSLRRKGNEALRKAWLEAGLTATSPEVTCIKNLMQSGLPRLEAVWQQILEPLDVEISLGGAICHPIPQVDYGAPSNCELADLLIVHTHSPPGQPPERRAALMQAKLFGPHGVTSRNETQKNLYQRWPAFSYSRWPGGLGALERLLAAKAHIPVGTPGSLTRDLSAGFPAGTAAFPGAAERGSRYAMVDRDRADWDRQFQSSPWRICSPNVSDLYTHRGGMTLPGYLVRLLIGHVGRNTPQLDWPTGLANACQWSLLVTELLETLPASKPAGQDAVDESDGGLSIITVTTSGRGRIDPWPPIPSPFPRGGEDAVFRDDTPGPSETSTVQHKEGARERRFKPDQ